MDDEQFDNQLYDFWDSIKVWVGKEKVNIFNCYKFLSIDGKIEILKTLSKEFIRPSNDMLSTSIKVILSTRNNNEYLYDKVADNIYMQDIISYETICIKMAEDILYYILLTEILPGEYEKINKWDNVPF